MRLGGILSIILFLLAVCVAGYLFFSQTKTQDAPLDAAQKNASTRMDTAQPSLSSPLPTPVAEPELKTCLIRGRVVDDKGKGIPRAKVKAALSGRKFALLMSGHANLATEANEKGVFILEAPIILGAQYTLRATAQDYVFKELRQNKKKVESPLVLPDTSLDDVEILMSRTGGISGHVVDQHGRAIPQVFVRYGLKERVEIGDFLTTHTPSDSGGNFEISRLEQAGEYVLWGYFKMDPMDPHSIVMAYGDPFHPLATVKLAEGEWKTNIKVVVQMDDNRVVEGRVIDLNGVPVVGANVWAVAGELCVGIADKKTTSMGSFQISSILPEYSRNMMVAEEITHVILKAEKKGYEPGESDEVPVGAKNVDLLLQRERLGTIACHLYDAHSGDDIGDAEIYLKQTTTEWGEQRLNKTLYQQVVEKKGVKARWSDGKYILSNIPIGSASILVCSESYGIYEKSGIVVNADTTTNVEIPLEAAGLLCVQVLPPPKKIDGYRFWCRGIDLCMESSPSVSKVLQEKGRSHLSCRIEKGNADDYLVFAPEYNGKDAGAKQARQMLLGNMHRDFVVSPGEWRFKIAMAFTPESLEDVNTPVTVWECKKTATVKTNCVTSVVFDVQEHLDTSGNLEVKLPADRDTQYSIRLVSGKYSPFTEEDSIQSFQAQWRNAEWELKGLIVGDYCSFDFIPDGDYTLIYYPYISKLTFETPLTIPLTVASGVSKEIELP